MVQRRLAKPFWKALRQSRSCGIVRAVAILPVAVGKAEYEAIINSLNDQVYATELYCLRGLMLIHISSRNGTTNVIMVESYTREECLEAYFNSTGVRGAIEALEDEELLTDPISIFDVR